MEDNPSLPNNVESVNEDAAFFVQEASIQKRKFPKFLSLFGTLLVLLFAFYFLNWKPTHLEVPTSEETPAAPPDTVSKDFDIYFVFPEGGYPLKSDLDQPKTYDVFKYNQAIENSEKIISFEAISVGNVLYSGAKDKLVVNTRGGIIIIDFFSKTVQMVERETSSAIALTADENYVCMWMGSAPSDGVSRVDLETGTVAKEGLSQECRFRLDGIIDYAGERLVALDKSDDSYVPGEFSTYDLSIDVFDFSGEKVNTFKKIGVEGVLSYDPLFIHSGFLYVRPTKCCVDLLTLSDIERINLSTGEFSGFETFPDFIKDAFFPIEKAFTVSTSKDGKIYLYIVDGNLYMLDLENGTHTLIRSVGENWYRTPRWSNSGNFLMAEYDGVSHFIYDVKGKKVVEEIEDNLWFDFAIVD